jgi:F-type H+-transporting ATPase subunit epsilon
MADTFALEVVTPERTILRTAAESVVLRTAIGGLTILDGHAALIAEVVPCEVRVEQEGSQPVHLAVHGGFLQIDTSQGAAEVPELEDLHVGPGPVPGLSTRVTLLAGIAELAEEIDVERARRSKEAAESRIESGGRRPESRTEDAAEDELSVEDRAIREQLDRAELRLAVAGGSPT